MPTCTEYPPHSRSRGILMLSQDRSISKERKMKIVKKEIILPLLQDFWCLLFIFYTTSGCFDMLSSIGCIIPKSICLSTVYKLRKTQSHMPVDEDINFIYVQKIDLQRINTIQ